MRSLTVQLFLSHFTSRGSGAAALSRDLAQELHLLANDHVDDSTRYIDELLDLLSQNELLNLGLSERKLTRRRLISILGQPDLPTHLAVDLNAHDDERLLAERFVKLGPCLVRKRVGVSEQLPRLLSDVRRHRREEQHEGARRLPGELFERREVVGEDHQAGDGGVEGEGVDVGGDLANRLVHQPLRLFTHLGLQTGSDSGSEGMDAVLEAYHAGDLLRLPRLDRFQRAHEHLVEAHRVGAVEVDDVVGVDDVAARLGHLLAIAAQYHPLVDQLLERLGGRHQIKRVEHLVPEARVEQVQHGVLGAADVQVDRQPRLLRLRRPGRLRVGGVSKA
mmetsp:Transcript_27935/g.65200  ORF Transcript_27935/g.65200 Transcript_27935/m.65200 type:complete len:334 (-) Transcript_27935:1805-2806(-)